MYEKQNHFYRWVIENQTAKRTYDTDIDTMKTSTLHLTTEFHAHDLIVN